MGCCYLRKANLLEIDEEWNATTENVMLGWQNCLSYIESLEIDKPTFEEKQSIIGSYLMGTKLLLIWESVLQRHVIQSIGLSDEELKTFSLVLDEFLSSLKKDKEELEELSLNHDKNEFNPEMLKKYLEKAELYYQERRKYVNQEHLHKLALEKKAELHKKIKKELIIIQHCQSISYEKLFPLDAYISRRSWVFVPPIQLWNLIIEKQKKKQK